MAGAGSTGGSDVLPGPAALRRGAGAFSGGGGTLTFRQLCGGDRELLQEVGDLSDACCALAEYAGEYQFFLGLQMGLELGALDLLGAEEEETLSHARALSCS